LTASPDGSNLPAMDTDLTHETARPLIAFVDDEVSLHGFAAKILEQAGYRVVLGVSADDGIALRFGDREPDVLLMNMWGRAKAEGIVAIRRRERAESRRRLPVAIQSGRPPTVAPFLAQYHAEHPDADTENLWAAFVADPGARRDEWVKSGAGPYEMSLDDWERDELAYFEATLAADAYLVKPYTAADCLEVVERLIALGTATRT
jgi:CheY-like chemotaxis protein